MGFEKLFFHIGLGAAKYPLLVSSIAILLVAILLSGLVFLDFELEPQKLWVAQNSQTNHQQLFFGQKFGAFYRVNQVIMRYKNQSDPTDIFNETYLEWIFWLQGNLTSASIEFQGKKLTVDDLCFKPIAGKGCMINSPTNFWHEDYEKMMKDDVKETARCLKTGEKGEMPCFDAIGTPIQINAIFGQQGCTDGSEPNECRSCYKTARSMAITIMLNNDFYMNKAADIWEKEVMEKTVHKFNDLIDEVLPGIHFYFMLQRSVSDELKIESSQSMGVVVSSYIVMFIYISFMMGECSCLKRSRILVGLCGIIVVALSCLCAFSITSLMGVKQSLISAEVVPFLVLAIGVDNMFFITGARDRFFKNLKEKKAQGLVVPDYSDEEQIAYGLMEVGPSITTAAAGEFLAFLVGYMTNIPALQSFCLCASFAVLINYFLQMTVFVAAVSLDDKRVKAKRYDLVPFIVSKEEIGHYEGKVSLQNFVSGPYYSFLIKLPVQIVVLVIYVAMTVVSCIAIVKFPLGLNQQTTCTQKGDLIEYFKTQEKYVDVGSPGYLIFYNIDYNNQKNLELIDKMADHLATLEPVSPPLYSWYKDFQKFMNPYYKDKCNKNLDNLKLQPLASQVREFLKMTTDSACCKEDAICGEPYVSDISFNEYGEIEASRFRFMHVPLVNQSIYVKSVLQTDAMSRDYKDQFVLMKGRNTKKNYVLNGKTVDISTVFTYSLFYAYFDQYIFIRGIALQNILIGIATIFLAAQIVLNIQSAAVVILFCFSCVLHLLGVLWILNNIPGYIIELNAISVVNIVVTLGLSVEFCTHIILFYNRGPGTDKDEKVRYSLRNMGVSVLIGIMITKMIGVTVLLFAPSKVFHLYYFRMYFFLIIVGFFHSFMILPLFLRYVNISGKTKTDDKDDRFVSQKLEIDGNNATDNSNEGETK